MSGILDPRILPFRLSREVKMLKKSLKSTNPEVIKNAQASVKGKITSTVNSINALVKYTDGKFDHSKNSMTNAHSTHDKLVAS